MSSSDGNNVESLLAQLAERDAKIELLKSKTAAFVEKLKSGHAEALLQEQTIRQQLQDKLEAAKPIFIRFKDEKAALTEQLNVRTEELHNAEQSFKSQLLDLQKKIEEGSESQLKLQATDISSVNDQLEAVRLEARAAIEAGKRDSEIIVKKLTAQLNTNEESLAKRTQEHLEANALAAATLAQQKESNSTLATSYNERTKELESRVAELLTAQKELSDHKLLQEKLTAELAVSMAAATAEASKRSAVEVELAKSESLLVKSKAELSTMLQQAEAAQQSSLTSEKEEEKVRVAAEKILKESFEQLKCDLQLSEERLQEAEEAAWKAKAESSELIYALEQEQGSTKKLSVQVENLETEMLRQSAEHAAAVSLSNNGRDHVQEPVDREDIPAVDISLPVSQSSGGNAQKSESVTQGSAVEPLDASSKGSKSKKPQVEDKKNPTDGGAILVKVEEKVVEEPNSTQTRLEEMQKTVTQLQERCHLLEGELREERSKGEEHALKLETAAAPREADKEVVQLRATLAEEKDKMLKAEESHALQLEEVKAAQDTALAELKSEHVAALQESEANHELAISGANEYVTSLEVAISAQKEKVVADDIAGRDALSKQLAEAQAKIDAAAGDNTENIKVLENSLSKLRAELKALQEQNSTDTRTQVEAMTAVQDKHTAALAALAAAHSSAMSAREDVFKEELKEKSESAELLSVQHAQVVTTLTEKCNDLTGTISTLTARCSQLEGEAAGTALDSSSSKDRENELIKQVEVLKNQVADTHRLALETAAAPREADKEVVQLRATLAEEKDKLLKAEESHALAIKLLQEKEIESERIVCELIAEQTRLVSQHKESEGQAEEARATLTKTELSLEGLRAALRESEERALLASSALSASEKSLRDASDSAVKKAAATSSDVQKLEASLASKKFDLDASKANLAATTTAYSALSAQHNQLKAKVDQLTQQLEAENQQTQERKQKVREYVDKLNAEKRDMEEVKEGMVVQLATAGSKISALEALLVSMELKVQKEEQRTASAVHKAQIDLEQQQQDHNSVLEAKENLYSMQIQETDRLQGLLDEHATATAEEVQEAYRRMALSGKELESHKAKRLVARNEMIGAAQALERSQSEGQALRAHIQYKLAPIVFEQVAALEMLLSAVEHFRSQLSSKSNVRLHNTASEYLSRRLVQSAQVQPSSPSCSPESSMSSINSNTALTLRNNTMKAGDEVDSKGIFLSDRDGASRAIEDGHMRSSSPLGTRGALPLRGPSLGPGNVSILGEAMEQAEVLRRELNRVHAGLSLLSHSVDRLGDIVAVDSRCCGGVFQMLSDSMTGSIEGTIRGSIVGRTLVSHNNNSSSGRARPVTGGGSGIGGMISSGLGYTTVSGDEGPGSFRQGSRRSTSPLHDLQSNNNSQKDVGKNAISAIDSAFSILPHDEDEDGEELEII